jgi:outer membrane protein assembly factor BamD
LRRIPLVFLGVLLLFDASLCSAQIPNPLKKKKVDKSTDTTNTAEPDKQLYDKAMDDIKRGRHDQGRLALQTLINTYPDSEYLAKAKLAIADSYFKEGGTSNTLQAIAAYKDFGVFFPFLPEAAYAQLQVAKAHYNEMPKPDRDNTQARQAEEEFQTFLQKYPNDPLAAEAQQRLREVQEVLAEGQFRVGYYYYLKGDKRAAAGRLMPLANRYPLYSKTDEALWMLGDIYEKSERKDISSTFYAMIVRNYPLSSHVADATAKLKSFGAPIPQPDPKAVAWMTAEQNTPRPKESLVHRSFGALHSKPDVDMAAHNGAPNMEPESDTLSGGDILKAGSKNASLAMSSGSGSNAVVEKVRPGDPAPATSSGSSGNAEEVTSTTSEGSASDGTGTTGATTGATPAGDGGSTASSISTNSTSTGSSSSSGDSSATTGTGVVTPDTPMDKSAAAAAPPANATSTTNADGTTTPASTDSSKESTSKKKGIKKLIPW